MRTVLLVAVVIVSFMALIKDGRALRKLGLTGGCTGIAAPAGETGYWVRCTPGKLQGAPNLSRQSCTVVTTVGKDELWRCPAPIDAAQGT